MIEWSERAEWQLDRLHDFIAWSNGQEIADRIAMQIIASVDRLAAFPMSGRSGRARCTRELVIANTPYLAAYEIQKARIYILAIYHGAQQWPEVF